MILRIYFLLKSMFTIITPTYNREEKILKRCLDSIDGQTYTKWKHLIIVDNIEINLSQELIDNYSSERRQFICLGRNSNDYGNSPRQLGIELADSDFIVFVDDDNVIFPNYLSVFASQNKDLSICQIIHLGPLPQHLCPPPKILDGNPPILQNIDTLQICVRTELMKKYGWINRGYLADGYTIQNLAAHIEPHFIEEILGVHM